MPVDYKALLEGYMGLVINCEAYSYLEEAKEGEFTEDAMAALREIEVKCYDLYEEPDS